jgi:tyrosyl-tRNA synthetase
VLATEATALVHGRSAADQAAETARKTFEEGAPAETLPTVEIENGVGILNAAVATGAVSSTSEARRQIKSGGIKLNGVVVVDEKMTLTSSNATPEGLHVLSFGKKRHFQLKRK